MRHCFDFFEFFAGGGMARAGLGDQWQCRFANDFDPVKALAYGVNWGSAGLWVGDVAQVTTDQLGETPDLVWASFPCQDLSLAGNGAGLEGARSGSFWPFWRLMQALAAEGRKPRTIVLENVCGLLTSHGGADFAALCEAVARAGYWIGALVIDAQHFLPQSRPRLFVVAVDDMLPVRGKVFSARPVDAWHPKRLRVAHDSLSDTVHSRWLWFDPPLPHARSGCLGDVIEDDPADVRWHSGTETCTLLHMMSTVNREKVALALADGARIVGAVYKRTRIEAGIKRQRAEVRFDVAGCLRTPSGGSSRQSILVIDAGRIRSRLLSARETARLMGLPDSYRLPPRYNDAYHLTGDGVAVPVVRHLARHLLEPILSHAAQDYRAVA